MPLIDSQIRSSKPKEKAYRLFDGGGLYLEIAPGGGKWWRLKYRIGGKEKRISLGVYPEVGLKEARDKRDANRKLLANAIDPGESRKARQAADVEAGANSFEVVGREWYAKFSPRWVKGHADRTLRGLEKDVFPWLGSRPIRNVTASELLTALRRIENRGAVETAHRVLQTCGQVLRYAIATGRAERDLSVDLRGALPPVVATHHASITEPKAIGELLRAIEGYKGSFVTKCALRLAPLVFVRPGELRNAEWDEINLGQADWRIPGARMKMRVLHVVPLSKQAVSVLEELHPLTGRGKYLFPSVRTPKRPMSENTVNAALRRLGYTNDQMTGHGFRSMASTLLNEQGWNRDAIERQLAHAERDAVRAAYNYAEHLAERQKMMQAWADYLDGLKQGAEAIPLKLVSAA
jgi:integrase